MDALIIFVAGMWLGAMLIMILNYFDNRKLRARWLDDLKRYNKLLPREPDRTEPDRTEPDRSDPDWWKKC